MNPRSVDITLGSFTNAVGSAGGYSCGSIHVSDHQRLSSQAYCFSASMPAILTNYSIKILDLLADAENNQVKLLKETVDFFYNNLKIPSGFHLISSRKSPIVVISASNDLSVDYLYKSIISEGLGVNLIELAGRKFIQFFITTKQQNNISKITEKLQKVMLEE